MLQEIVVTFYHCANSFNGYAKGCPYSNLSVHANTLFETKESFMYLYPAIRPTIGVGVLIKYTTPQ
jgi:hypothetical protein